jgi:hypothetical protein
MPSKKNRFASNKKKLRPRLRRVIGEDKLSFPDTKISEAFLEFAQPLVESAPPGATEADMEEPLKLAFTVWNAVVYADAVRDHRFLEQVRQLTSHDRMMKAVVEQLIQRKRDSFGDDHRLVGEYAFYRKNGELRFRAEARDPRPSVKKAN